MLEYGRLSDQELLVHLGEEDRAAFTAIYERYWQMLFVIAYNRTRSESVAKDIVHDVFTALWAHRGKNEIQHLRSYLATAVKYLTIAHYRRAQVKSSYASRTNPAEVADDTLSRIDNKRILELIKEEIEKLPDKCRLIFKYSRELNKSTQEIANELNISKSTVENHLHKALGRLRVIVKNFNNLF